MLLTIPAGPSLRPTKLLCIGRNYAAHVREMGDVEGLPSEPVIFLKPPSALVANDGEVVIPRMSKEVHHEVELVVVIGKPGKDIETADAMDYVAGYALGLDMTARDLQTRAKDQRGPWSIAKGFDTFAPIGPIISRDEIRDPHALDIELTVGGTRRQQGSTRDLIFPIPDLVSFLSRIFTLEAGDLIFTGTPEGVGPVRDGDFLQATARGEGGEVPTLRVRVTAQSLD